MAVASKLLDVVGGGYNRYFPNVIDLNIRVQLDDGTEETWPFTYDPRDTSPITVQAKAWLEAHPDFKLAPAVELRAIDLGLNRRNVRTVFIGLGLPADAAEVAIQNKPAGGEREELLLSWLEDDSFRFDSPVVIATFDHWAGIDPNLTLAMLDAKWLSVAKLSLGAEPMVAPSEAVQH